MNSVISVNLDSLPGNTKKQGIDPFVADQSAISPSFVYNAKPQTPKSLGPQNFLKFVGPKLFGVCGLALYTKFLYIQ